VVDKAAEGGNSKLNLMPDTHKSGKGVEEFRCMNGI
jgi:hypothetical protein